MSITVPNIKPAVYRKFVELLHREVKFCLQIN